jgi:hypothetical protein
VAGEETGLRPRTIWALKLSLQDLSSGPGTGIEASKYRAPRRPGSKEDVEVGAFRAGGGNVTAIKDDGGAINADDDHGG